MNMAYLFKFGYQRIFYFSMLQYAEVVGFNNPHMWTHTFMWEQKIVIVIHMISFIERTWNHCDFIHDSESGGVEINIFHQNMILIQNLLYCGSILIDLLKEKGNIVKGKNWQWLTLSVPTRSSIIIHISLRIIDFLWKTNENPWW